MNVLSILNKRSKFFYFFLFVFGAINSLMASSILYFINTKLGGQTLPFFKDYEMEVFTGIMVMSLIISYRFEIYMITLTERIGVDMQKHIFRYLRYSDYERYLILTEEKVRTAFGDVSRLQAIPHLYISMLNNFILVIIGLIYLLVVNMIAASLLLGIIGITAAYFLYEFKSIERDKNKVRDLIDNFSGVLNDFLFGFRELKMSIKRSDNIYVKHVMVVLNDMMLLKLKYLAKYILNRLLGRYTVYIIIGVILFVLPSITVMGGTSMVVFVTTFLFIASPIGEIITQMDSVTNIRISLSRLDNFEKVLNANMPPEDGIEKLPVFSSSINNIKFRNVEFQYTKDGEEEGFKMAPLNLTIKKGEIIFITGGNGSGKSTFINLLTGLLKPTDGEIYYNNQPITEEYYPQYRNLISCVFTDNYLFNKNYDEFDFDKKNKQFYRLLDQMLLTQAVKVDVEKNKVDTALSKGQKKRLALILALMEEKDIFVFDEWAAEQDPEFRKYFYRTIIQQLKAAGKTVIAITHDDAYFDCADRMIKFGYGAIINDEPIRIRKYATVSSSSPNGSEK